MLFKSENLCFSYYKKPLCLKDINFYINEGQKVVFLASKDMGKTTLLKVLSSFESSYFGKILLNEKELKTIPDEEKRFSLVLSEPVFEKGKSIRKNFNYFCEICKIKKLSDDDLTKIIIDYGIEKNIDCKIKNLSLFERRKLALARAELKRPTILFLDCQFEGLNEDEKVKMCSIYQRLFSDKTKTIVSSVSEEGYSFLKNSNAVLENLNSVYYLCDAVAKRYKDLIEFEQKRENINIFEFLKGYSVFEVEILYEESKYKVVYGDNVYVLDKRLYKNLDRLSLEPFDSIECYVILKNENIEEFNIDMIVEKLNKGQAFLYSKLVGEKII